MNQGGENSKTGRRNSYQRRGRENWDQRRGYSDMRGRNPVQQKRKECFGSGHEVHVAKDACCSARKSKLSYMQESRTFLKIYANRDLISKEMTEIRLPMKQM